MKRLTTMVHGKSSLVKGMSIFDIEEAIDHLVAIEDILGDEYDLDELAEKVQANREGRCVVLPESYYTAEAAARKASGPAEQSERGQAAAWIMQRFGRMS